jgi:hypothetical protein
MSDMLGKSWNALRTVTAKIVVVFVLAVAGIAVWDGVVRNPADIVERCHGIKLPTSARNIQHKTSGGRGFLDRGALSLFEVDQEDVQSLVAQLSIKSRNPPARGGLGDPRQNGWNVWPERSATFVPGNTAFGGLRTTWQGVATPIEMLSCNSSKGDWLHVEIWSVERHTLVKIYTDWN